MCFQRRADKQMLLIQRAHACAQSGLTFSAVVIALTRKFDFFYMAGGVFFFLLSGTFAHILGHLERLLFWEKPSSFLTIILSFIYFVSASPRSHSRLALSAMHSCCSSGSGAVLLKAGGDYPHLSLPVSFEIVHICAVLCFPAPGQIKKKKKKQP